MGDPSDAMESAMKRLLKPYVLAAAAPLLLAAEVAPDAPLGVTLAREAAAVVGAPLTPVSYAGVARRTTRRAVVATSAASSSQQQAAAQQQQQTAQQQQAVAQQQAATAQQQAAVAQQQAATAQQQAAAAPPPAPGRAPAVGTVVPSLPAGCVSAPISGVQYYDCGGVSYRPAFQGNNLVYVVQKP
jgi:hypothetical protein